VGCLFFGPPDGHVAITGTANISLKHENAGMWQVEAGFSANCKHPSLDRSRQSSIAINCRWPLRCVNREQYLVPIDNLKRFNEADLDQTVAMLPQQ
jgi:hypothetical protein